MYFNCQTNLISKIKKQFGSKFEYEGKRAIIFKLEVEPPYQDIQKCITMALTYYLKKTQ
jgi:hypothetical protein